MYEVEFDAIADRSAIDVGNPVNILKARLQGTEW